MHDRRLIPVLHQPGNFVGYAVRLLAVRFLYCLYRLVAARLPEQDRADCFLELSGPTLHDVIDGLHIPVPPGRVIDSCH